MLIVNLFWKGKSFRVYEDNAYNFTLIVIGKYWFAPQPQALSDWNIALTHFKYILLGDKLIHKKGFTSFDWSRDGGNSNGSIELSKKVYSISMQHEFTKGVNWYKLNCPFHVVFVIHDGLLTWKYFIFLN